MHGTDDIRTSGGYFHMANVFYRQNKLDVAFSLYNQVRQYHDDCIELKSPGVVKLLDCIYPI